MGYRAKRDRFPILSNRVISTGAAHSFIVRCVVERPPHFAFAFAVVFAVHLHLLLLLLLLLLLHLHLHLHLLLLLLFSCHPSPQAEDLLLVFAVGFAVGLCCWAFAVVFVVHLYLLLSCHPSPQAEDLLLAFAVVVAGRIGI
jgi:hypothetical protein